jgi:hypothetical protein
MMLASGEIPGHRRGQPASTVTENARGHEFDSRKSPELFFGSKYFVQILGVKNFEKN